MLGAFTKATAVAIHLAQPAPAVPHWQQNNLLSQMIIKAEPVEPYQGYNEVYASGDDKPIVMEVSSLKNKSGSKKVLTKKNGKHRK